ncbi:46403_t:CDS:2, partial [Gigaspora margarita]
MLTYRVQPCISSSSFCLKAFQDSLIDLYSRAVQNNNEQEIEKILDKFSLNRTNDIGEQIDQMQGSQWSNLDSHKNFTVFREK